MRDECDTREAETRVHHRTVRPETWASERRIHGEGYASGSADGHLRTINDTNCSKCDSMPAESQWIIRRRGWHTKAKWIDATPALHINKTMPTKSSLLPKRAALGFQFHTMWQLETPSVFLGDEWKVCSCRPRRASKAYRPSHEVQHEH